MPYHIIASGYSTSHGISSSFIGKRLSEGRDIVSVLSGHAEVVQGDSEQIKNTLEKHRIGTSSWHMPESFLGRIYKSIDLLDDHRRGEEHTIFVSFKVHIPNNSACYDMFIGNILLFSIPGNLGTENMKGVVDLYVKGAKFSVDLNVHRKLEESMKLVEAFSVLSY